MIVCVYGKIHVELLFVTDDDRNETYNNIVILISPKHIINHQQDILLDENTYDYGCSVLTVVSVQSLQHVDCIFHCQEIVKPNY